MVWGLSSASCIVPRMRICPSCKTQVANNARVCPNCGHRFWTLLAKIFFWIVAVPLLLAVVIGIISGTH